MTDSADLVSNKLIQLKKSDTLAVFKMPTVPQSKRKQKVLDEDTYVEEMGRIIQRDFFPDLEKMKAQNEYLDAIGKNDVVKIRQLYAKYSGQKPIERLPSPATFETPANIHNSQQSPSFTPSVSPSGQSIQSVKVEKYAGVSLDQYLSSHTSEDNQSFEEMMVEAEKVHRAKYSYLYQSEQRCHQEKLMQLMLPSSANNSDNRIPMEGELESRPFQVDTWTYRNRNYIMYIPDGVSIAPEQQLECVKRKQEVVHNNTRLDKKLFNEKQSSETITELAKSKQKVLDGKIGVDGKELVKNDGAVINGFRFVRTPSPSLGVAQSPLMTWGEIEGTPFRLDGSDTPLPVRGQGPAFKMAAVPRREELALALAEKASERHRDKKKRAMDAAKRQFAASSPSPRCPPTSALERLASMSPAARHLTAVTRRRLSTSSPVTPRTRRRMRTPTTPAAFTSSVNAPAVNVKRMDDHLTDDLLQINVPKRKTAADFFSF